MTYSTHDLMLGIQIRAIATQFRDIARAHALKQQKESEPVDLSLEIPYTQADRALHDKHKSEVQEHKRSTASFAANWDKENPIHGFVPAAMTEVERFTALALGDR